VATFLNNDYGKEMARAMNMLARDPHTLFLYQNYGRVSWTLADVPEEQKIDMPIIEDVQMGMAVGLSLAGFVPVSCYARWNFLLCAANQLVNHVDKLEQMSGGGYKPGVIIRTAVGSTVPLYPGCQSDGDYTAAFRLMLTNVDVVVLKEAEDIYPEYTRALRRAKAGGSTLLVEIGNLYENQ
jgi:pyruvate/2-oxoglutarate/acetoin dehydrogenase E1 component